jgi:endonuclease YncB( thermonuclease family)
VGPGPAAGWIALIGLLASVFAAGPSAADSVFDGRVVRVFDGDTIEVLVGRETVRVRLAGIDTPERGQPWAERAKQALAARVSGQEVRINRVDVDRYGRTVGEVYADNVCVGCELVRDGHAWVYRRFNQDAVLLELEAEARAARRGLWGLPETERVPPWEWRQEQRERERRSVRTGDRRNGDAPAFVCGAKHYCREMQSCSEARYHLEECGLTRLDGDGDGVPCEGLCRSPEVAP